MMTISVIVGSTRQGRFSEKPAQWILQQLQKREGIEARLLIINQSSGESGFHDGHAAVHGQPHRELNGSNAARSARGVYRINSPSHVRYADGCTHRKCGWSSCSIGMAVSSMRLRTRNSRSVVRASARVQCRTSWILRTPSACRPCSVSTGPRFTSASQRSCSCSGDIGQVYNAPEYLLWR